MSICQFQSSNLYLLLKHFLWWLLSNPCQITQIFGLRLYWYQLIAFSHSGCDFSGSWYEEWFFCILDISRIKLWDSAPYLSLSLSRQSPCLCLVQSPLLTFFGFGSNDTWVSGPRDAFLVHCVRLAPPGLLFDPVDAACRGRVCFPCRSCWRECGRCWATGQSLLPWACSRGYYLGPAYSLMVLLEVGGRHFPGPPVLLGRRMGSGCWACGAGSVSRDLLSSASCANMLLIPRVPVPLREGNITRGRLLL